MVFFKLYISESGGSEVRISRNKNLKKINNKNSNKNYAFYSCIKGKNNNDFFFFTISFFLFSSVLLDAKISIFHQLYATRSGVCNTEITNNNNNNS